MEACCRQYNTSRINRSKRDLWNGGDGRRLASHCKIFESSGTHANCGAGGCAFFPCEDSSSGCKSDISKKVKRPTPWASPVPIDEADFPFSVLELPLTVNCITV